MQIILFFTILHTSYSFQFQHFLYSMNLVLPDYFFVKS